MPLAILAAANAAVSAIQQGCELYKEYKGTVLKAKATFEEVQGIAKEVTGVWSFLKSKFFGKKEVHVNTPTIVPQKTKKQKVAPVEHDELQITLDIIAQLKIFFSCMTQLKQKLADAELHSLDAKSDAELLSSSVDIEYAMSEIAKLQKTIRETMVYQIGGDLGDLYTKVVKRVGIIQEQQEVARLQALKKKKDEIWLQNKLRTKRSNRIAAAIVVLLIMVEVWACMVVVHLSRHT